MTLPVWNQQIDPISIFYDRGGNTAVQVYVWDGAKPILWNGQVTFSGTISIGTVSGTLTNNNAAPAANNFGVLPAVVSTTNLNYTAGNQALLRVDTTGALIVSGSLSISTTGLATSANQTNASQKTQIVDGSGNVIGSTSNALDVNIKSGSASSVNGTLTNNNAAPAANNLGVLPAIVSTTALGYTQGNQALLRVDTTGSLVVSATISTTGLALASNQTDGSQKTQVVNTTGTTQAFGAGTTTSSVIRVVLPTDQTSIPVSITTGSAVIGHVIVDSGNINSTVSGTVTATISNASIAVTGNVNATISNATISVVSTTLATAANQTNGSQLTQIVNTTANSIAFGSGVSGTTTPRMVLTDSTGFSTTALTSTAKSVTTAAARLTGYYIYNPNASAAYVQVFNATTGAITLGTTVPIQSYGIPATSAANVAGKRVSFSTAISIAATTTMYGSTGPSTGLDVNFDYE